MASLTTWMKCQKLTFQLFLWHNGLALFIPNKSFNLQDHNKYILTYIQESNRRYSQLCQHHIKTGHQDQKIFWSLPQEWNYPEPQFTKMTFDVFDLFCLVFIWLNLIKPFPLLFCYPRKSPFLTVAFHTCKNETNFLFT